MSKLAGSQLFTAPSSPAPAVVRNRASAAPKITARSGAARSRAPLFRETASELALRSGPTRAMMMRSSWISPIPSPQRMGSKIDRLTNPYVVAQLWGELNPHKASSDVTLCHRFDF